MFPARVYIGDSLSSEWNSDADSGSLSLRLRDSDPAVNVAAVADMVDAGFRVSLDKTGLTSGLWAFQVSETDAAGTKTISAGLIEVVDALSPPKTHNEKMVALLEDVLEASIAGRGDVRFYTIGDRQVQAAKTGELREELERYRRAVERERNPNRSFWHG